MSAPFEISRRFLLGTGAAGLAAVSLAPRLSWAQETPKRGGTLVVAADTEPRNLNPAIVASNGVFYVSSKIVEPLVEMAADGKFTPLLATAWEGSPDGKAITFRLRSGVKWHDGTPFTSADVAFSALEVWAKLQNFGRVLFKDLTAVETPDATTAIFRFAQPTPLQLILNAAPAVTAVVPKHLLQGSDIEKNPYNQKPVGTGPFKFGEYKPGEYYRLDRNPDYWDAGKPYLDRIIYRVLPDRGAVAAAHEAGEIQLSAFSAVPLAELPRLAKVPGLKVVREGYDGITYALTLEINHRRAEFQNVLVRRALAHAIDQRYIVETIFKGYASLAVGPIPASAGAFFDGSVARYPFDVAKAEALLDQAGYKRGADGTRFAVKLLPAPWFEQTRQAGDYVRQALRAVGIDATIVANDPAGHTKAVYTDHAFDLAIGSPVYRNDPAISTTILYQSGLPAGVPFSNQYGYADPEVDRIIAEAQRESDPAKRVALYARFQQIVADQVPQLFLAHFTFITVASDRLRDIATNPRWATASWADAWLA